MSTELDLSQLAGDRPNANPKTKSQPISKNRWVIRYVLPLSILLAFGWMFLSSAWETIAPSKEVSVTPVISARAEVQQSGQPLFQAAGWIEPSPAPIVVSSQAPGIIDQMLVVDGQAVAKGEPIARLIDVDAKIALEEARSDLELLTVEVRNAEVELLAAQRSFDNPVSLHAAIAEANAALAKVESELNGLPSAVAGAVTQERLAQENFAAKQSAGEAIAKKFLRAAEDELASAKVRRSNLETRSAALSRQQEAIQQQVTALNEQLRLKLDATRDVSVAKGNVEVAKSRLRRAELKVRTAELQLERMTVRAPVAGRVLSILATPGKRLAGLDPLSEQGASAVVALYQPTHLQIRVDVRLEDISQVQLGQPVEIETAALQEPLLGEVISVTSTADIQKNTLQVKVKIIDPPEVIRPEMLAQATFISPQSTKPESEESQEQLRLLVPRNLVLAEGDSHHVWIADRVKRQAVKRSISLGRAGDEELVEVVSGLTATDKLISSGQDGIEDGQRIRIGGES